jgi:hypothetical protein
VKFLDFKDPFYAPLWIRISVVVVCIGWGLLEISNAAYGWAAIFIGLGTYAAWQFKITDYSSDKEEG